MRSTLKAAIVCLFFGGAIALAQRTDATVSGTVTDPTNAQIATAIVTALNLATGSATTVQTNEAGIYVMPSLLPGKYTFSAQHAGFRKTVLNEVDLQVGTVLTLNLQLELGQTTESVEVQATAVAVNATSSSVGTVVEGKRLLELPLAGRSSYDLLITQPGVQVGTNFYLNGNQGGSVNFTMDGITAMDNLHSSAFYLYSNVVSVDRAEEFRVVTSPADAEYGRGSGQVQMVTRGGTNKFAGSAFYEVRNAAFNANTFFNNAQGKDAAGNDLARRSQLKQNNYGIRFGGPLKKNKTFFNGIWEPYKQRNFTTVNNTVYTSTARQGIFRFYPGVQNANATSGNPTVDLSGNPVQPAGATGPLQSISVLGRDPSRLVVDPTGVMAHVLGYLPLPNNYKVGDGLNTAGFTWNRPVPVNFELYEGRIDHLININHRIAVTLNHQSYHSDNVATPPPFPDTPGQSDPTETTQYSVALTSVVRPNLLNDARVGIFRTRTLVLAPYDPSNPDPRAKGFLPVVSGNDTIVNPTGNVSTPYGNGGIPGNYLNPTYQWGDNMTLIKGRHSFKGGFELRYISLAGFDFGASNLPLVTIGAPALAPATNISSGTNPIAGIGQNAGTATNLLYDLAGAVNFASQLNISPGGKNPAFLSGQQPYHEWHQNEFSGFFKDDFKLKPSLTINFGVRYEFYAPPTEAQGKMVAPVGAGEALFGISGKTFASLFNPNATGGSLSVVQAIGAGTSNDIQIYNPDRNNFAPALGLAWSVPGEGFWRWLSGGKNKMTIRMGYGIGFQRLPIGVINTVAGAEPGLTERDTLLTFTNLSNVKLPVPPTGVPLATVPLTGTGSHTQTLYALDQGMRTPYSQNFNFTITRALTSTVTLNLAYVGSKGSKLVRSVDTDEVNIYENGLLDAFNIARAGGESALINRIFSNSYAAVAAAGSGSNYVRTNSATQGFFANNNPGGFANFVSSTTALAGTAGALLSNAGLPLNFIVANPQFLHTYLTSNFGNSTYHSFQIEVNKRFSHGYTMQSSYVWSHNLGESEGDGGTQTVEGGLLDSYRTLRNEKLDKRPLSFDYQSVFKINGLYELPFGRGKLIGGNANGFVDRIIGGWQLGAVGLMYSGRPLTFSAQNAVNVTSSSLAFTANALGALPSTGTQRIGNGVVYFNGLTQVVDPSVAGITTAGNLRALSGLKAIADASGNPILVNPLPGQMGALGGGVIRGPGAKNLNMNLLKRIRVNERVTLQIGATAQNVTNTPIFGDPQMSINSTAFGRITGATGNRVMVLQGRVYF